MLLRDPDASMPHLIAPPDRIVEDIVADDPHDPDNLSPRLAKRALHHVVRGRRLLDIDASVLEALAGLDGAVVTDHDGRLLTFGAILRIDAESLRFTRAVESARDPRRAGRLVPRTGPEGQRGRVPDHVPGRQARLGALIRDACGQGSADGLRREFGVPDGVAPDFRGVDLISQPGARRDAQEAGDPGILPSLGRVSPADA